MNKRKAMRVVGAMSGTSLDGVDAAEIVTDGQRIVEFGPTAYRPYTGAERAVLRAALGQWDGPAVQAAAEVVETAHAELFEQFPDAELFGFHGQTLAHDPDAGRTHQAGNGALLAEASGRPVVWDFRSTDMEMGGQGAPLAPFYHFALARWIGAEAPLVFLNLGGVGNLTWVDPGWARPDQSGALLAFDTGPANAPINDLMQVRRGQAMDEGGGLAAGGIVDGDVVRAFLDHPYFYKMPPKSLDRDSFADLAGAVQGLGDADAAATLTACAAGAVARGIEHCPAQPDRLILCGGGRHNAVMRQMVSAACDLPVVSVDDLGVDGDMIEAQAFAFLAVRVLEGMTTSAPGTTGVRAPIGGGRISRL